MGFVLFSCAVPIDTAGVAQTFQNPLRPEKLRCEVPCSVRCGVAALGGQPGRRHRRCLEVALRWLHVQIASREFPPTPAVESRGRMRSGVKARLPRLEPPPIASA